jgi:ribosomal protein L11 methyltransferase
MFVLEIDSAAADTDRLIAELWERGTTGVIEEDLPGGRCLLRAFFEQPFDVAGWTAARWIPADQRDWVAEAQSQWEPLLVGERFFLVPSWRGDPAPPGRLRLEMQPGQACGTGWHPATRLALEALERWLRPGMTVLDLGTGSGILAVAASLLGAGRVLACDIDPGVAPVARDRFRRDGVPAALFVGSIRSIRPGSLDLLVANIHAEALVSLAGEIQAALQPAGIAVLSGFPARHLERVRAAFPPARDRLRLGDWTALIC